MRAVIQRVQHAGVRIVGCDTVAAYEKKRGDEAKAVEKEKKREIGQGFLILLGVCEEDTMEDVEWLVKKIANLRVFDDENHVMNRSIIDIKGEQTQLV